MRRSLRVALFLVGASFSILIAQRTTQITGRITDPSEAIVPQAQVSVINEETGFRQHEG